MRYQTEAEAQIKILEEETNEITDLQIRYYNGKASVNDLNEMLCGIKKLLQNTIWVLKRV